MKQIRNFTIIAHIDHGKSTLADRMLEITHTIEGRKMKDQVLDNMDLERERGITIKMCPVQMKYKDFTLNLIDTPGHIDFSYEVSRALKAVEGALLLVDATQGIQAQTLTTLSLAQDLGLVVIPVISKVDSPLARVEEVKEEVSKLLNCSLEEILETSGKTGRGVEELLEEVVSKVPAPKESGGGLSSLVFDFEYSSHRGVIVYVRIMDGQVKAGDNLIFKVADKKFNALEVGIFTPEEKPTGSLEAGSIGYIVTGIKEAGIASVGDTVSEANSGKKALAGYKNPYPVVWASVYPESQDDFTLLTQALERLKLSDSSLSFEEESSGALGRGYRCGFLGMLHLEIVSERLRREFDLDIIVTTPSITYEVELDNGSRQKIYSPIFFPDDGQSRKIFEPWVNLKIITPNEYVGQTTQLLFDHEAIVGDTHIFGGSRMEIEAEMPLRELMRGFFDRIKSATSGFASLSYEMSDLREADVVRLDVLVAEEVVPAFSRVVSRVRIQQEANKLVEKLYEILPKQLFTTKIQAKGLGRILASKTLSALRKDVTGHLYGGDVTRKKKLLEKQKKGKKKMKERGKVNIPHDVFMKMMSSD